MPDSSTVSHARNIVNMKRHPGRLLNQQLAMEGCLKAETMRAPLISDLRLQYGVSNAEMPRLDRYTSKVGV